MKGERTMKECEQIYQDALILFEGGLYSEAAAEFARIPEYRDAADKKTECEEKNVDARLDETYMAADKAAANMNVRSQEKAIKLFETISGYRDSKERIEQAKHTIEEINEKEKLDREEAIRLAEIEKQKRKMRKARIIRILAAAVLAAAACIAGVFLFKKYAVPAMQYRRGVELMEAGNYDEAFRILHKLDYKDSNKLIACIAKNRLKDAEVGSTVLFGAYPQASPGTREMDPIEWIVLDKIGNNVLLISKYALDALPYTGPEDYENGTQISWENCSIRKWMNGTFMDIAFDEGEKQMLQSKTLRTGEEGYNVQFSEDRVFLLSTTEAMRYFPTNEERQCLATKYALGSGAYRSNIGYTCLWWLRTPCSAVTQSVQLEDAYNNMSRIGCVGTSGQIVDVGHDALNLYGVRPVIWVDIEAFGD